MNFMDLNIKTSYISMGDANIAHSLITPALKIAINYKRSVGFFSSSGLKLIMNGVLELAHSRGTIQLITSPMLSEDDIEAINKGYETRDKLNFENVSCAFEKSLESLSDTELKLLVDLISNGILDIKIAITDTSGSYHDKMGIITDKEGNMVAFFGSANSSLNGYQNNYEKVRVARSWIEGEQERVEDELNEFNSLWNNTNEFVRVLEFSETAKRKLLQVLKNRNSVKSIVTLRDYQEEAIKAWVDNNYHGFFTMATGTGKTWTAIYAAKKLLETHKATIVICAPYKHLVRQWADDVKVTFPTAKIIMISSDNPKWESDLKEEILRCKYNSENQIIAIATIASFNQERFQKTISRDQRSKLLIVDEAHRLTNRPEKFKKEYSYMLGLSATPYNGRSKESGNVLMDYFGGSVFNLPIEKALGKYLVNYFYYPIFVSTTIEEENSFNVLTAKMASCFRNGILIDPDGLIRAHRNRLRLLSMAKEKISKMDDILDHIKERDHFIVYCGDGRLFDNNTSEELRHIQYIKKMLNKRGHKPSQFTATENMNQRMELVDSFNKGEISSLVAIRCLDEGINIPSIESALILSSNDNYREFVQRRGRILRQYLGKKTAKIYDVIVLPSQGARNIAIIELRRFLEYARLALNYNDLQDKLDDLLQYYSLEIEDILMFESDELMEVELDE